MIELRCRSRISKDELDLKIGKILTPGDVSAVLQGDALVRKPNGDILCIYLKNVVPQELRDVAWPILSPIKDLTDNRGLASGSIRQEDFNRSSANTRAAPVASSILGAMDPMGGRFPYCRLTAWTGKNSAQFEELYPYFAFVGKLFSDNIPDRYEVQQDKIDATHPDWVIPGTPFTTVTVNNTYATGVHKDVGDLKEGFSCLTTMRKGDYTGGILTFPEFRIGVEMQDGDVLLMDAHEWHGNTQLTLLSEDAERISVVLYFRARMTKCGSSEDETRKGQSRRLVANLT